MEYEIRAGDFVRLTDSSYMHDHELLYMDEYYEVIDVDHGDSTVSIWLNPGCVDDDYIDWWVPMSAVEPRDFQVKVDKTNPHWKIIKKIKEMELRRKSYGYSF